MLSFTSLKKIETKLAAHEKEREKALHLIAQCEKENHEYRSGKGMHIPTHGENQDILIRARDRNTKRIHEAQATVAMLDRTIAKLQGQHRALVREARVKEIKKRLAARRKFQRRSGKA